MKFMSTIYIEFSCFEIQTIFVTLKMTAIDVAALTACSNITEIIFFCGMGFANIFRTRLNHLIGMKESQAAKNFSYWFVKATFYICMVL